MRRLALVSLVICGVAIASTSAAAPLVVVDTKLDRPTVATLGVQVLISGDDDFDATIAVRYRVQGASDWRDGMPLWRVHPEVVVGRTVPAQFAGSIFDLLPGTTYEIELHAIDANESVDQTWTVTSTTRVVPHDPIAPHYVNVTSASELSAALKNAKPSDVIVLADGTYSGTFSFTASGTSEDAPIVIRGGTRDGVILDGGACTGCNVFESYGSWIHLENLTIAHGERAIRFQTQGAQGNVVRRVHVKDVRLGIGSNPDQLDFYVCDDVLEGRLTWPMVWGDDQGAHANDDGVQMQGFGHVVCHNTISGFGDAMKIEQNGARAIDFYGNEVLYSYDNAMELDETEGNSRCFRNRFTNVWSPLSFQPIFGGPAYAFRNVVVNAVDEQEKLHSEGANEETVGALLFNNTFVSTKHALNLQTSATAHYFVLENQLYVGPEIEPDGKTVDWSAPVDHPLIDHDGFFPDGFFDFGAAGKYVDFATMVDAGSIDPHGVLLTTPIFSSGLAAPADYRTLMPPPDAYLARASNAVDHGVVIPNVTDDFQGAAPDLGALELDCPQPTYGPRSEGVDESNEIVGCSPSTGDAGPLWDDGVFDTGTYDAPSPTDGGDAAATPSSNDSGGCGCRLAPASSSSVFPPLALIALTLSSLRRRIAPVKGRRSSTMRK